MMQCVNFKRTLIHSHIFSAMPTETSLDNETVLMFLTFETHLTFVHDTQSLDALLLVASATQRSNLGKFTNESKSKELPINHEDDMLDLSL